MTLSFGLHSNLLTGSIPSQLGGLTGMTCLFQLSSNRLCGDVTTEITKLGTETNSDILTGNSIGVPCCETLPEVYTYMRSFIRSHAAAKCKSTSDKRSFAATDDVYPCSNNHALARTKPCSNTDSIAPAKFGALFSAYSFLCCGNFS